VATASRRVLIIGPAAPALKSVVPLLRRSDFEVEQVEHAAAALEHIMAGRVDLLLARYPTEGVKFPLLLDGIRERSSPCRDAGLLLMADPEAFEEARGFLGRGVNRVVNLECPPECLLHAVADLIGVPPRIGVRALVQLDVNVGNARTFALHQTHNLSTTGMFVAGDAELPAGARCDFELSLPGQAEPIRGSAEVVWHADRRRHLHDGFALRFLSFREGDGARLRAFVARRALPPAARP
jgi:hypothetical protein